MVFNVQDYLLHPSSVFGLYQRATVHRNAVEGHGAFASSPWNVTSLLYHLYNLTRHSAAKLALISDYCCSGVNEQYPEQYCLLQGTFKAQYLDVMIEVWRPPIPLTPH
jgi:hypothetical protein